MVVSQPLPSFLISPFAPLAFFYRLFYACTMDEPNPTSTPTPTSVKHPQGEHGHFTTKDPVAVGGLLHTVTEDSNDDTLVDVHVNNPLHRITKLLQDIKAHQSTTVSLRFTIPLIALPIVLLAAFQLGRFQTSCSPVFASQLGTVRILSLEMPKTDQSWYAKLVSFIPGNFGIPKTIGFTREDRSILLTPDGQTLTLLPGLGVKLFSFDQKNVIVSGEYSACNKALTVDSAANVQVMK